MTPPLQNQDSKYWQDYLSTKCDERAMFEDYTIADALIL
jgi:hypothetical protein